MQGTTLEDRKKELRRLLDQMSAHPERDWTKERERVAVLREMVFAAEARSA